MTIISVKNMALRFGITTILEGIDFALEEGDKVGIIGENGCGKSSLFKVITGEYTPEEGSVGIFPGKTLGILTQEGAFDAEDGETTVFDRMLETRRELLAMEAELAGMEARLEAGNDPHALSLSTAYTALQERFAREGGLEYRSRCASLLMRLGFDAEAQKLPVRLLSGGQKTRLALAVQLFREPDLLLLDEPTNHLDIGTVTWLEDFLIGYKKTVLVISHDRYFLDRVTGKTLHIENHHAKLYIGGYTASIEQRRLDRELAEKHYKEQQKEIAHQEAYIAQQRQWNRERNIIAAESRQKLLDKMVRLEKPKNPPRPVRMQFRQELASGNDVLSVRHLGKRFGDRTLFSDLNFLVKKQQRVLVIGENGCGKSTLIRLILGQLPPDSGVIEAGYNVEVGYYDQENQNLTPENSVIEELWSAYPTLPEVKIRSTLAMFRFVGEDVFKPVSVLSGGERARLTLSKLILSHMNLLVLDEPTNHLDIDSREALESALEQFDGTVFAVSHDRYFIEKLATRILEMKPGAAFPGDLLDYPITHTGKGYSEFLDWKAARVAERQTEDTAVSCKKESISASKAEYLRSKQSIAEERKKRNRLEHARAEVTVLEESLLALEEEMAIDAATDYKRLAELDAEKNDGENRLLALYEEIETLEAWMDNMKSQK